MIGRRKTGNQDDGGFSMENENKRRRENFRRGVGRVMIGVQNGTCGVVKVEFRFLACVPGVFRSARVLYEAVHSLRNICASTNKELLKC
jgi:hypothetical protein